MDQWTKGNPWDPHEKKHVSWFVGVPMFRHIQKIPGYASHISWFFPIVKMNRKSMKIHEAQPVRRFKITVEHCHLLWAFPLKMVDLSIAMCTFTQKVWPSISQYYLIISLARYSPSIIHQCPPLIVSFPIKNNVMFHSFLYVYQRVYPLISQYSPLLNTMNH